MDTEIKLRKYEHLLVISGTGVIAFGLWSVIKALLAMLLNPLSQFKSLFTDEVYDMIQEGIVSEHTIELLMAGFVFVGILADVLLRIYIGRRAIRDGRGTGGKRRVYLIWAVLVSLVLLLSLIQSFHLIFHPEEAADIRVIRQLSVSWIVDLTSLLALAEMIRASILVRRLRRKMEN